MKVLDGNDNFAKKEGSRAEAREPSFFLLHSSLFPIPYSLFFSSCSAK